ncbi:hypothetical protein [Maridesulfovibrio sp.]|uniref:hypothetical protein n=1 Tax=Maridesulfovibrio sp. TaxID=2795000 RepID=UPI002AA6C218|nr:hypothetical protein [Maridesulfovibrio sp.]
MLANLFVIGLLGAQIAIVVGLIKPTWVKATSRKKVLGIYGLALIVCFVGFGMTYEKPGDIVSAKSVDKKMQQVAQKESNKPKGDEKAEPQEKIEIDMDEVNKRYEKYLQQTAKNKSTKPTYSNDPAVKKLQDWVVNTCNGGSPFNQSILMNKLGAFELTTVTKGNPNILKAFYYPNADMTIIANVKTRRIVYWRLGRQGS